MIQLRYSNTVDIDSIRFADGYEETCYLNTELDRPEYPIVIEGDENGDLENIPTFRKWEKVYSFSFVAFEFLVDAISKLPIYDNVTLTANGVIYNMKDINIDVEWQEGTIYALVTVQFTDKYLINRITNENMS